MDSKRYVGRDVDWSDPMVKRAQEILLGTMLESYRANRASTPLETEILREAEELAAFIVGKDTRTFCILSVSFMEDALKRRFAEQWKIDNADKDGAYFGSNGPLSTFSQRLMVAKGLGWLDTEDLQQASVLRKIRNFLAHNHRLHEIDRDPLVGLAESLRQQEKSWYNDGMENYVAAYEAASKSTILKMRVFCNATAIVSRALRRSKLMDVHLPPDLRDGDGFHALTELEQGFIDLTIRHCFVTLGITRSSRDDGLSAHA